MAIQGHSEMKQKGGIYWFTTSIVNKENVFVTKEYFNIIIGSFKHLEIKRNVKTVLYCIMPNHLHWSFKLPEILSNPINIFRDFKRYTAREIIKRLNHELQNGIYNTIKLFKNKRVCSRWLPEYLLQIFEYRAMHKRDQNYKVWEEKSDLKVVISEKFFIEKVEYCHNNPIQPKWQLVDDPLDYPYSSCRFYEEGEDWNELEIFNPLG